ncbi:hypothetical protein AVEN_127932-1 [Araneus ventricosus]|uniref:Uncharacterized protein n=1 Tax=Araneus ventricosus TaxID=182803 RepID=A0A4Y1ZZZ7_ARAVE|nr:hypothetical protein AVEN_127932-1 [Araneus ventricosus]
MGLDPGVKSYKVFTDGSKMRERVACGAVFYEEEDKGVWSFQSRINDEATVFIAEAVDILKSIRKSAEMLEDIYIFTDSRSVLIAL